MLVHPTLPIQCFKGHGKKRVLLKVEWVWTTLQCDTMCYTVSFKTHLCEEVTFEVRMHFYPLNTFGDTYLLFLGLCMGEFCITCVSCVSPCNRNNFQCILHVPC